MGLTGCGLSFCWLSAAHSAVTTLSTKALRQPVAAGRFVQFHVVGVLLGTPPQPVALVLDTGSHLPLVFDRARSRLRARHELQ